MEHRESKFQTFDNLSLYEQCWRPDEEPKAVVIIVHGSFEHSERYAKLALFLVHRGYAVHTFDLRGHGKSEGERAYIRSFDLLVKDLESFLHLVRLRELGRPIFLLGHSVGGTIIVLFLIAYKPSHIRGAILSAPTLKISDNVSCLIRIFSPIVGFFFPRLKLDRLDTHFLSRDPEVVSSYHNDPLVYKQGLFAGAVREFIRTINKIQPQMEKINLPLLILHGTEDYLSDIKGSKQLYIRASSMDKTLKLYEGFYHELFNEPGKERVFTDIILWLEAKRVKEG